MSKSVQEQQSSTFYCQKICGDQGFDIKEWNRAYNECLLMGLSESETSKILEGEPCTTQCVDCACIVGERRIKTQKLIDKMNEKSLFLKDNPK